VGAAFLPFRAEGIVLWLFVEFFSAAVTASDDRSRIVKTPLMRRDMKLDKTSRPTAFRNGQHGISITQSRSFWSIAAIPGLVG